MHDYNEKPKRKRGSRNPYLFLGAGILIGLLVAGILVFLLFFGVERNVQTIVNATPTPIPFTGPTVPPFSGQAVQPTPIANRIQAASVSPDGRMLAYVSVEEGVSHIYINELRVERNLTGNQYDLYQSSGYYNDVIFSPDGSKLVAAIDNGPAVLFDVTTRTMIEQYLQIGGAAFTPDGNTLVLAGRNNGIRVLDLTTSTPTLIAQRTENSQTYTVGAVAINRNQDVAIGYGDRIEVYNLADINAAPQVISPNNGFVQDLVFHPSQPDTLAIALAGTSPTNGVIQIYDLSNTSRIQYDFETRVFALDFSPNGEWLAVGGGETGFGESKLIAFRWDATDSPLQPDAASFYAPLVFEGHEHSILDVSFTREGYLLSAGWDGSVRLWELIAQSNAISVYYP